MSVFEELKRRNVVRVGIAYVVIGWVLAQVAEFAADNFGAPDWVLKMFVVFLLLGLPLALFFAWAFEMTPDGIKREKDVDRSQSVTQKTGRKLDRISIGVLVLAVGVLLTERFIPVDESAPVAVEPADVEIVSSSQSIAVLPFVNMSDDKDYFADGLSEELLNLLAKIPDLKVAGRTSSFAFKGRNDDFAAIGDALKVEHVLEGSVRRSGDTLRVTAQLIKVADGYHLWSETYDRTMEDIFAIQDDLAGAITSELQLRLAPASVRPTESLEAYELYLEVLGNPDYPNGDVLSGIALLDRAIELDPGFAKAHEQKAMLYWLAGGWTISSSIGQDLVYQSAIKALELDPTLVVARSFSVSATPVNWSWVGEIEAIEEALKSAPNDMRILDSLAYDYTQTGYFSEALAMSNRMIEIDPLASLGYGRKANALYALGRDEEAQTTLQHSIDLGNDENGAWFYATALLIAGEDEQAITIFENIYSEYGLDPSTVRSLVENARDPDTGKEYLVNFVNDAKAEAQNFLDIVNAQAWYQAFGYLDEFWREIEETTAKSQSSWSDADALEHTCRVFAASGCASHPRAIVYALQQGMTDLWDRRGPPDRCSKDSGEWVCN